MSSGTVRRRALVLLAAVTVMAQGGTPALDVLTRFGVAHEVRAYEHDARAASYGLEAAEVLGVDPARVFKTLMADAFVLSPGYSPGVGNLL